MPRRSFLKLVPLLSAAAVSTDGLYGADGGRYRAAIIGHTGRGDYGHGLDLLFNDHPRIEVVAVADPDEAGRKKAVAKAKASRNYAAYRTMLEREKPQLVCVAPRWTEHHFPMIHAALESGAHVFSEKPFTQTLAEADELLALASRNGLKIAVAHQMRLAPSIVHLQAALQKGLIGELVEIRAFGKQDSRAGGEDMLVLGTHLFDLIRLVAGDPQWCFARVLSQGREITRADARRPAEEIGPVAGDDVHAQFGFAGGVMATFISTAKLREATGHWGLEFIGSKANVRILADAYPQIFMSKSSKWIAMGRTDSWNTIDGDPTANATPAERAFGPANRRLLDDWLKAIEQNREPACSGEAGMKAIEMVMAVYESALSHQRVSLPLQKRTHPLD